MHQSSPIAFTVEGYVHPVLRSAPYLLLLLFVFARCGSQSEAEQPDGTAGSATYAHDVAPVLERQCVRCHNATGGAPFSLQTYADAKQWGSQILEVTQNRYMPPWLPAPQSARFAGERRLTDQDLGAIRRWIGAGMPEGSGGSPGAATYSSQTQLQTAGRPALELTPTQTIHVPASGGDVFLTLAVPVPAQGLASVKAIGIAASDPQAAHSILIGVDRGRELRREHPEVLTTGLAGMELTAEQTEKFAPAGQLLLWTPDAALLSAPATWTLPAASDLILTVHAKTTGKAEDLTLKVSLFAAKAPSGSRVLMHVAKSDGLDIAANAKQTVVDAETTLSRPATITAVYPRAHYLLRRMRAYVTLPGGKEMPLLAIEKWDVDWTQVYRLAQPMALPKGSVVHLRCEYDNSSDNPHNPSDPPVAVTQGHSEKDEVAELWLETSGSR